MGVGRAGRSLTQLTSDASPNTPAAWLLDSKRLMYSVWPSPRNEVHVRSANGSGQTEILEDLTTPTTVRTYPVSTSPDGSLAFTRYRAETIGLATIAATGMWPGKRSPQATVIETARNDRDPRVSPDGRWMAFESDRTGRYEIYVSPFPDLRSGAQPVTTSRGAMPVWSRKSEEHVLLDGRWRHGHDHDAPIVQDRHSAGGRRGRPCADRSRGRHRTLGSISGTNAFWCSGPSTIEPLRWSHHPELVRGAEAARTSAVALRVARSREVDKTGQLIP